MTDVLIVSPPFADALPFLEGGLSLLVVGTTFASFLIPAAVLLFFLTPVRIWRSPLFVFNVMAIIIGLALQTLYIYVILNATLHMPLPAASVTMIVALNFLVPVAVQGILLIRLLGVYPPSMNTRRQNLAIYVPVVAFKIARLATIAYVTGDIIGHWPDSIVIIKAAQLVWSTKYVKVELILQLFDDTLVSGLFVHRLYVSMVMRTGVDIHTADSGSGSRYSWAQRIRTLYYIAVSNFVFPILFNIAEIAVIFYDPNVFHGAIIVTANCYVTIFGVLLATIWAQGSTRGKPALGMRGRTTTVLGSLEFAPRDIRSNVESEMVVEDEDESTPRMRGKGHNENAES